jgi:hypothetical protein
VPQDQRSQARLVSKPFFNAVELSHFSLGLILPSEMEQLARVFGRYKKPIRLSFKKTKKLTVEDMKHLTAITQLTAFSTACEVDGSTLVCLTNLLSLHVPIVTSATLQQLSKLTHIQAQLVGDGDEKIDLSQLKSFDILDTRKSGPNWTCRNVTSMTYRSKAIPPEWLEKFKHLQVLKLECATTSLLRCQWPSGLPHLTSLSLGRIFLENINDVPWHQLQSLSLSYSGQTIDIAPLKQIALCTNLTSLNLHPINHQQIIDTINLSDLKQLGSMKVIIGQPIAYGSAIKLFRQSNKESMKNLHATIYRYDGSESLTEIGEMTNLESLKLNVQQSDLTDFSPLTSLTNLTSLVLTCSHCKGLDYITNMTKLNEIVIDCTRDNCAIDTLHASVFENLTRLMVSKVVKVLDIRGATRLQVLHFNSFNPESTLDFTLEEMQSLKEIEFGCLSQKISWNELAKLTALESIKTESFNEDESILVLRDLTRLTQLSNNMSLFNSSRKYFDLNDVAHLTRLQLVIIKVPPSSDTNKQVHSLNVNLPRLMELQVKLDFK